ncbi:hypothetical protein [Streptomyces sp. NPDC085479]|uniref:hypothetical protein n=1 Tax=Streptomyces sp. NPDC085479 TaxID=3365726 RepID=UPI0037CE0D74
MYFAVGQAAALRNGAQTAADAAALGAAQDARDQLRKGWLEVIGDPAQWPRFVQGEGYVPDLACQAAIAFASANGARLVPEECVTLERGFAVTVQTEENVGESIVPGTGDLPAKATATAVVEPLCEFNPSEPSSEPSPEPDPSSTPSEDPEEEPLEPITGLICAGESWEIDPEKPELPGADVLFRVRLTDDE